MEHKNRTNYGKEHGGELPASAEAMETAEGVPLHLTLLALQECKETKFVSLIDSGRMVDTPVDSRSTIQLLAVRGSLGISRVENNIGYRGIDFNLSIHNLLSNVAF